MKSVLLILIFIVFFHVNHLAAQSNSNTFKDEFEQRLESGDLEDGCTIIVEVINLAANAACYAPDPTISKVACTTAIIVQAGGGGIQSFDPNSPNLITSTGVRVCQLTYATTAAGLKVTYEFGKNQTQEIKDTWDWLNTLEGGINMMYFLAQ